MVIELRVVQFWSEIILVIWNQTRAARSFDFEITRMISDQIALHSVQLPLLTLIQTSKGGIQVTTKQGSSNYVALWRVRPVPNAAPLMCRTKLNTVWLWSDFGATADSDGVLASDLIREGHGKQFSMRIYAFWIHYSVQIEKPRLISRC